MSASGADLMREFIKHSPFANEVGLEVATIEADHAVIRLPFRPELATFGPVLHGGAIAAAADVAAMAAAFAGADLDGTPRGATVGFSLNYLTAVRESGINADAQVARRGRSLNFVDVRVRTDDDELAATGHVVYKISRGGKT